MYAQDSPQKVRVGAEWIHEGNTPQRRACVRLIEIWTGPRVSVVMQSPPPLPPPTPAKSVWFHNVGFRWHFPFKEFFWGEVRIT